MSYWEPHVPTDRKPFAVEYLFTTADIGTTLITGVTGIRLYVCHLQVSITTTSNDVITVRDDASTPVPIAVLTTDPTVGTHEWFWGPDGIPLTLSEGLQVVMTPGNAGALMVHGYSRRPGPVTEAASKSTW